MVENMGGEKRKKKRLQKKKKADIIVGKLFLWDPVSFSIKMGIITVHLTR